MAGALLALAGCTRIQEEDAAGGKSAEAEVTTVSFTCSISGDDAVKSVIGTNDKGKRQNLWENGDKITVYSQGNGDSGTMAGYAFSTSDNDFEAEFSYTGGDWVGGNVMAIYPATGSRAVNFGTYRMAQVDLPKSQTLVAGSFDPSAAIATAYAKEGSTNLEFKNAVALLKFRVSDADIKGGWIEVGEGDAISGRFCADLDQDTYVPSLTVYTQTTYNRVDFTLDGSTSLSTGTDYYIAVRPTAISSYLKVYLNGYLVKSYTSAQVSSLERNKIYSLGTLTTAGAAETVLEFDFTSAPDVTPAWPTDLTKGNYPHVDGGIERVYPLYGTDYTFVLADCGKAKNTQAQVYINTATKALVLNAEKRYVGFPVISGFKLTKVVCFKPSGSTSTQMEIVDTIMPDASSHPSGEHIIAPAQTWPQNGVNYTYVLDGTDSSSRYYLYAIKAGSTSKITLHYERD